MFDLISDYRLDVLTFQPIGEISGSHGGEYYDNGMLRRVVW
jgi:hypothetical protein